MVKGPSQNSSLPPKEGRAVKIGEASKILGLHTDTLRRWEKSGKITPVRTPGGTRLYSLDELSNLIPKVLDIPSKPPPSTKPLPAKNLQEKDEKGIYVHIYNKGIENKIIFNDGDDYKVFLGFLKDYLTAPKTPDSIKKVFTVHGRVFRGTPHQPKNYFNKVELIAYSLTGDHFHLLLHQVTENSLESFIRSLCTRYSMYFNKKYKRTGALFEGPYKSVPVKDELQLPPLTRFFHHTDGYCSYPEYLGSKETSWIKPEVVLSQFNKETTYKDFVDKLKPDQKEKELIEGITFDSETDHLERRDHSRNKEIYPDFKPRSRIPDFLAISILLFILLVIMGVGNIKLSEARYPESSLSDQPVSNEYKITSGSTPSPGEPAPAVLSETKEITPGVSETTSEAKPKTILTVKTDEASSSVNIRQKPAADSEKIGQTKDGDTFEFVSKLQDWYEIKLATGSTGFISATYVVIEELNN